MPHPFRRALGACLVLAALAAPSSSLAGSFVATVQTTSSTSNDAFLVEDNKDQENGTKSELRLKSSGTDKNRHIVIAPTLPTLTNKTVLQAWLGLTEYGASSATPFESRVYPLLQPFDEPKVSWVERADKILWTTPGGTRDPRWSSRALLSTATNGERVEWQVGPIVNEWLLGGLPQYGFVLETEHTGGDREVVFRSSEYTSVPSATPRLTIYYTDEAPAVRRAVAEVQPTVVRALSSNAPFTLWLDVETGSTRSGPATGFDLVTIQHGGVLAGRSVDAVTVGTTSIPQNQITWYDNGTSITLRIPKIAVTGRVRVDFHADVLVGATVGTIELPTYLDDTETPSVWQQAAWPGNADGSAGNGDTWVVTVSAQNLSKIDLTPDSTSVVSRLCTPFALFGEDPAGNRFSIEADSFRVVPSTRGTISRSGLFCGDEAGTGRIIAHYGSFRDTSFVTVTPALTPSITSITLRDRSGNATNALAPLDTMFLDVTLSDGDGFRDVTGLDLDLYHSVYGATTGEPAFRATFRWRRAGSPSFTLLDPAASSWGVALPLCSADTVTNSTGAQVVRLAFRPGSITRASSSGEWNARVTAFSSTPPDTTTSLRTGMNARTRLVVSLADTSAAFAAGRAGAVDLPLRIPADGEVGVTIQANTGYSLNARMTDLAGVTTPGDTLRVGSPTRRVSWAFQSSAAGGGLLDTSYTAIAPAQPAPTTEAPAARDLYLWIDHPAVIAAQDYRGQLRLQAAATADTARSAPASAPVTATVASSGEAAQSAIAEVLPHQVQVGVAAQSMTAYLGPTVQLGNTGIDRIQVHIPDGYGVPTVTSVRVGGFPSSYTDLSQPGTAEARLSLPVITSSLIEIRFDVATPTKLDQDGSNFVLLFDDVGTSFPPQVAKEGDANGIGDGDTWKVVVNPGPIASVVIAPDSVTLYPDETQAFSAAAADAYGHPLTPAFTWSTSGGVGTVNGSGLFAATGVGPGLVTVSSGGFSDTARVTVRPTRGIQLLPVTGPSTLHQGQEGIAIQTRVVNLGADSVRLDTLGLVMTRIAPGDATGDFVASVDVSAPSWIAGGDTAAVALTLHVLPSATTGTVSIDARAVAVEGVSGIAVRDESAEAPLTATVLPGGVTVVPSQSPASVRPGEKGRSLLQIVVQNQFPGVRTVTSIRLSNATVGPGDVDQRDAELGEVTLYVDDGDGVLEPETDITLLSTVALGGSVTFVPLERAIPAGGELRLLAAANVPLIARDGDVLDLSLSDSTSVAFAEPVFFRNGWPLQPAGGFAIDGMVAGQLPARPVPTGSFVAGSDDNVALELVLPPNGYEADKLSRLGVVNHGTTLAGDDIERVRAWVDTGDRRFDPESDRLVGDLIFTGDRWQRTGLAESVPVESLRVFVTVDLSDLAVQNRTVRLGVPAGVDGGIGMQSGNSGPLDHGVENPFSQSVSISDRITWSAAALDSQVVRPGARGVVALHVAATNSYASDRTVTDLTFENATVGPGGAALLDGEIEALTLRLDGDGDGLLGDPGVDPVLGTSFFTGGRASFGGLALQLPAGESRGLFLVADLSKTEARDGDVVAATLSGPQDIGYLEPATTTGSWPLASGNGARVDGMVAAQIGTVSPSNVTVAPGDGPVLAFDILLPRNGYEGDALQGLRVVNLGTADEDDIAELRLWADGGDGVFTAGGDDRDLGALVRLSGFWQSALLSEPLPASGNRFFVSARISATPGDSVSIHLAVPVLGVTCQSGNDGPVDVEIPSGRTILVSTSPLLARVELSPAASTVGQPVTARLIVRNVGPETITGIVPSGLVASGTASLILDSGPTPVAVDLAPAGADTIVWTYHATSDGEATVACGAEGTGSTSGLPRRAVHAVSNVHRVYLAAVALDVFPVQSMPLTVSRGQAGVVPLSLTFTNGGGPGASDIRLRRIRVRLEDEQGAGVVPADLLTRVTVNEGTNVYLTKTTLETVGAEIDLTLAAPVLITGQEPVTLSVRVDVSPSTVVPGFRVVIVDSTAFEAEDATSGAPVAVNREGGSFPIQSGLGEIVSEATDLQVAVVAPTTVRVAEGASDVPLLTLSLVNPGVDAITSDVRVASFGVTLTDTLGNPIASPASRLSRLTVRSAIQTLASRVLQPSDGSDLTLVLSPPLGVPVNVPLDLVVACDVADPAVLGAVRARLQPAGVFLAQDAITRDSVVVTYATDPIEGGAVIVEASAQTLVVRGEPRFPSSSPVGDTDVPAMGVTLRHPSGPGTARIRVDSLVVQVRNEVRAPLVPATYIDRLRVVRDGVEIGAASSPPTTGSSIAFPVASFWIEPGDTTALDLLVDLSPAAPASWLELVLMGGGIGAVDANANTAVGVQAEPGAELPLVSGLTRLTSPARDLVAGWEQSLPAVLAADGREAVAATLRLTNTAVAGSGSIRVDRLRLQASDRMGSALPVGAPALVLRGYVDGLLWATSDTLPADSTFATLLGASVLDIPPGVATEIEIRLVPRANPGVDHFRIGIDRPGIGVLQPGGALLTVQVSAEAGLSFPFWSEVASFTPASLAESYSNFPNPFAAGRDVTTFAYYLRTDARVTLRLWTPSGEEVATLLREEARPAGLQQSETWDGRNGRGDVVRNGVYVAELVVSYSDGESGRTLRRVAVVR